MTHFMDRYRLKILSEGHGLNFKTAPFSSWLPKNEPFDWLVFNDVIKNKLLRWPKQTAAIMNLDLLKLDNNKFILEV